MSKTPKVIKIDDNTVEVDGVLYKRDYNCYPELVTIARSPEPDEDGDYKYTISADGKEVESGSVYYGKCQEMLDDIIIQVIEAFVGYEVTLSEFEWHKYE